MKIGCLTRRETLCQIVLPSNIIGFVLIFNTYPMSPIIKRGGETPSMAPGLVPSPRHLGGRSLLLAFLTGSERRGNSVHGARPRAVASSSQRMSSPARIPDWEREEGKLRPWRPASCRRPVISADVVSCSHP